MKPYARSRVLIGLLVLGLGSLAGCDPATGRPGGASSAPPAPGSSSGAGSSAGSAPVADPPASDPVVDYRVTYDWAVPSKIVEVKHTIVPPIAAPPAPPLPYLIGIYAANHPEAAPAYQRISFYFRGAYPGYNFSYVPSVLDDGRGAPVPLQGNAFLRVVFVSAQAHDDAGRSTVAVKPANPLGFSALKSYAPAGDFEGYVTYGLGLQVAPNSDQVRQIRTGELKRTDSTGQFVYVVFVDVRA